ncbi:MAG: hypothetical protein LCH61_18570 [Proteobacteria bacterium]|nr:hypothetical protein [Pseudomonadota bacterium]
MTRAVAEISALLLKHWDPIGIADVAEARDEYHPVAERLAVMLAHGASRRQVAAFLVHYEGDDLGLTPNPDRAHAVARMLVPQA